MRGEKRVESVEFPNIFCDVNASYSEEEAKHRASIILKKQLEKAKKLKKRYQQPHYVFPMHTKKGEYLTIIHFNYLVDNWDLEAFNLPKNEAKGRCNTPLQWEPSPLATATGMYTSLDWMLGECVRVSLCSSAVEEERKLTNVDRDAFIDVVKKYYKEDNSKYES